MSVTIRIVNINGERMPIVGNWPVYQGYRADYAEGLVKPHYPVPAIQYAYRNDCGLAGDAMWMWSALTDYWNGQITEQGLVELLECI